MCRHVNVAFLRAHHGKAHRKTTSGAFFAAFCGVLRRSAAFCVLFNLRGYTPSVAQITYRKINLKFHSIVEQNAVSQANAKEAGIWITFISMPIIIPFIKDNP